MGCTCTTSYGESCRAWSRGFSTSCSVRRAVARDTSPPHSASAWPHAGPVRTVDTPRRRLLVKGGPRLDRRGRRRNAARRPRRARIAPFDASDSASRFVSLVAVVAIDWSLRNSDPKGQADARLDRIFVRSPGSSGRCTCVAILALGTSALLAGWSSHGSFAGTLQASTGTPAQVDECDRRRSQPAGGVVAARRSVGESALCGAVSRLAPASRRCSIRLARVWRTRALGPE